MGCRAHRDVHALWARTDVGTVIRNCRVPAPMGKKPGGSSQSAVTLPGLLCCQSISPSVETLEKALCPPSTPGPPGEGDSGLQPQGCGSQRGAWLIGGVAEGCGPLGAWLAGGGAQCWCGRGGGGVCTQLLGLQKSKQGRPHTRALLARVGSSTADTTQSRVGKRNCTRLTWVRVSEHLMGLNGSPIREMKQERAETGHFT